MQAMAYEGYFSNGHFYSSGKVVRIPEQMRVFIAILDDEENNGKEDALTNWKNIKRMIAESVHENPLLTDDIFRRDNYSRDILNIENGEFE